MIGVHGLGSGNDDAVARIVRTADIDASASEVWSVLEDVRLLPQLSASTKQVLDAPERLTRPGDSFRQVVHLLGRSYTSEWVVKSIEPGRLLSIEGSVGFGVGYCLTEEVAPAGEERSVLTVTIDYRLPLGPLGRLAGKLGVEKRAAAESAEVVAGVKRLAEERVLSR